MPGRVTPTRSIRHIGLLVLGLALLAPPAEAGSSVRLEMGAASFGESTAVRETRAVVGDRLRWIALVDGNADGRFNDPKHDYLLVDHDADGRLDDAAGAVERSALTEPVRIGAVAYRVLVESAEGESVRLEAVSRGAADALRPLPEGLTPDALDALMASDQPRDRMRAATLLRIMRDPRAATLARGLVNESALSHPQRAMLLRVLSESGHRDDVDALLGLHERIGLPGDIRERIIVSLTAVRDSRVVKRWAALLAQPSRRSRVMAARLLGGLGGADAIKVLVKRGAIETDGHVLDVLLDAMAQHPSPEAAEFLIKSAKRGGPKRAVAVRALARLGFDVPVVRKFFGRVLSSNDMRERILALDLVAGSEDLSFCPRIAPSLEHPAWEVRQAAVDAMVVLRCVGSIDALVARIGHEPRRRLKVEMGKALYELTGVYFYEDAERWSSWWGKTRAGYQVPATSHTLPDAEAGGTAAGFYGLPLESDHVLFVIDKSGSMEHVVDRDTGTTRWQMATAEVLRAARALGPKAEAGVLLFDGAITPWRSRLARMTPASLKGLERFLAGQQPAGGTNLYGALEHAFRYIGADTIFIVSDGMPSAGRYRSARGVIEAVRRLGAGRRMAVHTISVGMASRLLEQLAVENRGRYVRR